MALVKKLISFDDIVDKDILDYLDKLPNGRKSEFIRQCLRTPENVHGINIIYEQTKEEEIKEDVKQYDPGNELFSIQS